MEQAFFKALDGLTVDQIQRGVDVCLKEHKQNWMPPPGMIRGWALNGGAEEPFQPRGNQRLPAHLWEYAWKRVKRGETKSGRTIWDWNEVAFHPGVQGAYRDPELNWVAHKYSNPRPDAPSPVSVTTAAKESPSPASSASQEAQPAGNELRKPPEPSQDGRGD